MPPGPVAEWTEGEVVQWLIEVDPDFAQYGDLFIFNNIKGKRLFKLTDMKLEKMGLTSFGHREDIMDAIEELKESTSSNIGRRDSTVVGYVEKDAVLLSPDLLSPDLLSEDPWGFDEILTPDPIVKGTLDEDIALLCMGAREPNSAQVIASMTAVVGQVREIVSNGGQASHAEESAAIISLLPDMVKHAKAVASGECDAGVVTLLIEAARHVGRLALALRCSLPTNIATKQLCSTTFLPAVVTLLGVTRTLVSLVKDAPSDDPGGTVIGIVMETVNAAKALMAEKDSNDNLIVHSLNFDGDMAVSISRVVATAKVFAANPVSACIQPIVLAAVSLSCICKKIAAGYAVQIETDEFMCSACGIVIDEDCIICAGQNYGCSRWFHRRCVGLGREAFECVDWYCGVAPCEAMNRHLAEVERGRQLEADRIMRERKREDEIRAERRQKNEDERAEKERRAQEARREAEEVEKLREKERQRQRELEAEAEKRQDYTIDTFALKKMELDRELGICTEDDATAPESVSSEVITAPPTTTTTTIIKRKSSPKITPGMEVWLCRAKFSNALSGNDVDVEGYLHFCADDIITVFRKNADGWWEGEIDGRYGQFHSSFVDEIGPKVWDKEEIVLKNDAKNDAPHKSEAKGRPLSIASLPSFAKQGPKGGNRNKCGIIKSMISAPQEDSFEHRMHLGYNPDTGVFESKNLPKFMQIQGLNAATNETKSSRASMVSLSTSEPSATQVRSASLTIESVSGRRTGRAHKSTLRDDMTHAKRSNDSISHGPTTPMPMKGPPPPPPGGGNSRSKTNKPTSDKTVNSSEPPPVKRRTSNFSGKSNTRLHASRCDGNASNASVLQATRSMPKSVPTHPPPEPPKPNIDKVVSRKGSLLENPEIVKQRLQRSLKISSDRDDYASPQDLANEMAVNGGNLDIKPAPLETLSALYSYKAARDDELSFEAGDVLIVRSKGADGWHQCTLQRNNTHGLAPMNFLA